MADDKNTTLSRFDLAATLNTIEKLSSRALEEANAEIHDVLHAIMIVARKTHQEILEAEKIEID